MRFTIAFAIGIGVLAQNPATPPSTQVPPPAPKETVVVTGTLDPVPLEEADRPTRVVPLDGKLRLLVNSVADILRLDPSLDLRSRAANGVQADLSIRGGSFGQSLILLDGMRLNDPQSGHHNLDVPVPLWDVERVEIMKGSGSAFYGSDATGGAVQFITRTPESTEVNLRTSVGNFGVNQQAASLSGVMRGVAQRFAFSRDFSTGFIPNRDYRNLSLSSSTRFSSRQLGATNLLLAHNDRPFGAEQAYGNFNSWERTRTWFAGLRQQLGTRTDVFTSYRRHTDLFVLYRDRPEVFTNRHVAESWQGAIRRREPLSATATLHYGAEGYRDEIRSTNLGTHNRARGAAFGAIDLRALKRFSLTVAAREELYGSFNSQLSPSLSGGYWLNQHLKLRAGLSRAFRVPSYTDLYYQDPANRGAPDLRPETAWSYEGGLDWNGGGKLRGDLTIFHRRERDVIDYVRRSPTDIWRATNFQAINFIGVETSVTARVWKEHVLDASYTGLRGAQDVVAGILSKYVFNYPIHQGLAGWQGVFPGGVIGRTRVGALSRFGRNPYAVWDVYLASQNGRWHPFVQFTNLTGTRYQEIPGVAMPGRAFVVGVEAKFRKSN